MELTVLLPTLNESGNLETIVPKIRGAVDPLRIPYEILVIDGNSTDATVAVAERLGCRVHVQQERGYAAALREGFQQVQGRYVVTMDADCSHDPAFIPALYARRHEAAIVIASRYTEGGTNNAGAYRDVLSRLLNAVYRRALRLSVKDCSCGYRLYRRSALEEIDIRTRHFEVLEEILIKVLAKGHHAVEVPIQHRPREYGVSKARIFTFAVSLVLTLVKLWQIRNAASSCDYDDRAFDSKIWLRRYRQRRRREICLKFLNDTQSPVLDIGCGSSRIIQSMPNAVALDIEIGKLRYVRSKCPKALKASAFALPFADHSFRKVLFSQVLEHIPAKPQILWEIGRILKPGGTLVIGTPDHSRHLWIALEWVCTHLLPYAHGHEHITFYTHATLRRLLRENGFEPLESAYVGGGELIIRARKKQTPIV